MVRGMYAPGLLVAAAAAAPTLNTIPVMSITDRTPVDGVKLVIGEVRKSPQNPLFVQDKPWEPRLDNGYPNVIYDPDNQDGLGTYRCFYGDCVHGCGSQILLYANSSDGITWQKPELGIFDVATVRSDLAQYGKHNNIIMKGGGLGIYKDPHEVNASRKFKCLGQGCGGVSGTAVSADGFTWTDPEPIKWPSPQRYDCHSQVLWVPEEQAYVATTRDGFSGPTGRTIGIAKSESNSFEWSTAKAPVMVEAGDAANQLYSQITFQWHGVFLGIVMVYDAQSSFGAVHCRLAWSPQADALDGWTWVDEGGLTGRDFIPLGKVTVAPCVWENVTTGDGKSLLSDCDAYREGRQPEHKICAGKKEKVESLTLAECKDSCSKDISCQAMQWQGLQANNFSADKAGQCFRVLDDCTKHKSYDSTLAKTSCMDIQRCSRKTSDGDGPDEHLSSSDFEPARRNGLMSSTNDFDSHVCFAAASPVHTADDERIYYMGGNGPHSGERNSSFALATLRTDGYAGMQGSGTFVTHAVLVTGPTLSVTADILGNGDAGSVRVGTDVGGLTLQDVVPITGNTTNAAVTFNGGKNLAQLIGKRIALRLQLENAIIYTVSFSEASRDSWTIV